MGERAVTIRCGPSPLDVQGPPVAFRAHGFLLRINHTIYVSFTEVTSDAEPKSRFSYQIAVLADSAKKITMIYYGRLQEPF